jgi:uncharacterized Zn finger protein
MACPQCGCQETYYACIDDIEDEHDLERCANCGCVFDSFDAAEDEDDFSDA